MKCNALLSVCHTKQAYLAGVAKILPFPNHADIIPKEIKDNTPTYWSDEYSRVQAEFASVLARGPFLGILVHSNAFSYSGTTE
jgi:hypothetical protein